MCRWDATTANTIFPFHDLRGGKPLSCTSNGGRNVQVGQSVYFFENASTPSVAGDGTVPERSGAGPAGHVKQLFQTSGYDHQGSYNDEAMLNLTQHLIARLVLAN